jgi:hypothetical protein
VILVPPVWAADSWVADAWADGTWSTTALDVIYPNAYSVVIAKARARVVVAPRQITQTPTDKPKVVVPV